MSVLHILFVVQHATTLILQSALSHVLLMDVSVQKEQLWISPNLNVCLKINVKVHNKSLHICRVSLYIIDLRNVQYFKCLRYSSRPSLQLVLFSRVCSSRHSLAKICVPHMSEAIARVGLVHASLSYFGLCMGVFHVSRYKANESGLDST